MSRHYREYSDEDVKTVSRQVTSMSQLLKCLGLACAGGNYINMRRILQRLNLTCDHWHGQAWNKDKQLKNWEDYTRASHLKPHLIKKRGNRCEKCGGEKWFGNDIPLEIHHLDGDRTNNREDNIFLYCCNCHSFTDNWRNKKHSTKK